MRTLPCACLKDDRLETPLEKGVPSMRKQVEFRLRDAMDRLEVPIAELARQLHINPDQISRLRAGTWTDITREQVQRLLLWADKNEITDLISIVPHPIWLTFPGSAVSIFIGSGSGGDGDVQEPDARASDELIRFCKQDRCTTFVHAHGLPNTGDDVSAFVNKIRDSLRTRNCIFVGGPRQSPASEVAIASLWGSTPFAERGPNAGKAPFEFVYPSWPDGKAGSSFASTRSHSRELKLKMGSAKNLRVPFLAEDEWYRWKGLAWDFGVAVICRRPLGTKADVTTIVLAGLGGLATWAVTCGLTRDLYLPSREVADDRPVFRVMCARFKKTTGRDNRTLLPEGSRWVAPPWKNWPQQMTKDSVRKKGSSPI